jgi:hypothetical protein
MEPNEKDKKEEPKKKELLWRETSGPDTKTIH